MKFKLMTYNVQDLFLQTQFPLKPEYLQSLSDREWALLAEPDHELKPLSKLKAIAQIIAAEDPDCVCLCEVGGLAALRTFNEVFLAAAYTPFLAPGNSERGIESGFLLHKRLAMTANVVSHREWPVPFEYLHEEDKDAYAVTALVAENYDLGDPARRKLSRDIPVLELYDRQGADLLSLVLVHLKSGYDPLAVDPGGQRRRAAEVRALLEIYRKLRRDKGEAHPVVVTGDFNGNASRQDTWPEFLPLYQETDLEDALQLVGAPRHERHTHVTFYRGETAARQLDYVFLGKSLHRRVVPGEVYVHRYGCPEDEQEMMIPFSFRDRSLLPSDHYPLLCSFELP